LAEIRWLASSYLNENGQLIGLRLAERLRVHAVVFAYESGIVRPGTA